MHSPAMDSPAELLRSAATDATAARTDERVVASGPLVLMIHTLLAIPRAERWRFRVITDGATLDADAAQTALDRWWGRSPTLPPAAPRVAAGEAIRRALRRRRIAGSR